MADQFMTIREETYMDEELGEEEEDDYMSIPQMPPSTNRHPEVADDQFSFNDRPETTDTYMSERCVEPDLTMRCHLCSTYVSMAGLYDHRQYHLALQRMNYEELPKSTKMLLKRRRILLNKLKQEHHPLTPDKVSEVNAAYDLLRSYLESTFDTNRRVDNKVSVEHVEGTSLQCACEFVRGIGICSDPNTNWKQDMEDTRVVQDHFGNDPRKCFLGLYDGYRGKFASEMAANELHFLLLQEMSKFDPRTKCTCTFNMAQVNEVQSREEVHSRAVTRQSDSTQLHEQSANLVQQIIHTCQDNLHTIFGTDQDRYHVQSASAVERQRRPPSAYPFGDKMANAFTKAYLGTDMLLCYGQQETSRVRWSGASCLSLILQDTGPHSAGEEEKQQDDKPDKGNKPADEDQKSVKEEEEEDEEVGEEEKERSPFVEKARVHLANSGNVHAIFIRANQTFRLSRDHMADNRKEKARIARAGGDITPNQQQSLVSGVMPTTRGLGNHGDPDLKELIICDPYTTSIPLDEHAQFLVLATNGLWEVFSPEEAGQLVVEELPRNFIPPPRKADRDVRKLMASLRAEEKRRQQERNAAQASETKQEEPEADNQGATADKEKEAKPLSDKDEEGEVTEVDETEDNKDEKKEESQSDGEKEEEINESVREKLQEEVRYCDFSRKLSEKLVRAALMAGAKDNISVMVVCLQGAKL